MQFNDSLISKLENLAKLDFNPEERAKIGHDLEKIMEMVNKLKSINTTGIEPLVYLHDPGAPLREDQVANQLQKSDALSNAPQHTDDFIMIPKVIDL